MFSVSKFLGSLISLKRNEKRSYESIVIIREKKLREMLKYAYNNSEFYRELYSKNGIQYENLNTIAIEDIPSITKKDMMDNLQSVLTVKDITAEEVMDFAHKCKDPKVLLKNKYQVIHSSGTTGSPGVFLYNEDEMSIAFSCSSRMHSINFFKKTKVAYYAGVDGRFGGVSLVRFGQTDFFKKFYDVCFLDMNEPLEKTIQTLNGFQPDILIAYGTGLSILATCQMEGQLNIHPSILENGGEGLTEKDCELLKKVYNVPIVNMYAASETYYLGIGKDEYDGIYLMDDFNYIEIMDGYILVTNLYNHTQPIIRYRINDNLTLKEDKKKILPFRLVDNLIGRSEELLWFNNEKGERDYIHPLVLTGISIEGLDKFHVVAYSEERFELLAILQKDEEQERIFDQLKYDLDNILMQKKMKNVSYEIKRISYPIVDEKTRKYKMIINQVKSDIK